MSHKNNSSEVVSKLHTTALLSLCSARSGSCLCYNTTTTYVFYIIPSRESCARGASIKTQE